MIQYDKQTGLIALQTQNSTCLIKTGEQLKSVYWGATVQGADFAAWPDEASHSSFDWDTNLERCEYPVYDGRMYTEPCLDIRDGAGKPAFLRQSGWQAEDDHLVITLENAAQSIRLELHYRVYEQYDLIARWAVLENTGTDALCVKRMFSGCATLPALRNASLRYLTGRWVGECRLVDEPVNTGVKTLQAKRGIPGPHFNPSFALSAGAGEEEGEVWYGALAYSGNWKINVEQTVHGNLHVVAGRNDFDAEELLRPGEVLETPALLCGYTAGGFGGMSRSLHAFQRNVWCGDTRPKPVLYNSWEATAFAVNAKEQMKLADKAAAMGVELFVVDDGWFGARNSDTAGLGDWAVNPEKFPNGLDELINHVKSLGMEFGIWVEPESVNPDSDLYRAHPEWAYHIPGVEPITARNQLLLDFSLPEVQAYVKGFLNQLLSKHDIRYLKWDMNRPVADVYSEGGLNGAKRRGHVEGLYAIWAWLREAFPQVRLESCSGGGGRVDMGILQWAGQFWPSDNTDPYERLFIQNGFSQFYAPFTMTAWVTETPNHGGRPGRTKNSYKFHSAMCGPLGIGSDISHLADEELAEYAKYIAQYKQIRETVQGGALYRLSPPESGYTAVEYAAQDGRQLVVFAFLHSQKYGDAAAPLRMRGLRGDTVYTVRGAGQGDGSYHGSTLMHYGLPIGLHGDFDSACIVLEAE